MIKIEQLYKEEHYLIGETLLDAGAVQTCVKERTKYQLTIKDETVHNVQVSSYGTKRLKATCGCDDYKQESSCAHVVAALLHVRAIRTTATTPKASKSQAFNINSILQQLTKQDMAAFIKNQAKKDKAFNYMLKAIYAERVQVEDNSKKYSSLLQNLIKPVSNMTNTSLTADIRLAVRLIHEFSDQLDDAIAGGDYTTAFDIMRGIWSKVHYLYRHYKGTRKNVGKIVLKLNAHVSDMYEGQLAPRLLTQVDDLVVDVTSLSYYNFIDPEVDVVRSLYQYGRKAAMQSLQQNMLTKDIASLEEGEVKIMYALSVLIDSPADLSVTDQQMIASAKLLQTWNANQEAISLLQSAKSDSTRNRAIEFALVEMLYETGQSQQAVELASDIFVEHREFRYLRKIKEYEGGTLHADTEESITARLAALDDHHVFKAMYFRSVEDLDNLLTTLSQSLDLRLLMEHDAYLYRRQPDKLQVVYTKAVDHYLGSHVGSMAGTFMTEVFAHLMAVGAFSVHKALVRYVSTNYQHRTGIIDYK